MEEKMALREETRIEAEKKEENEKEKLLMDKCRQAARSGRLSISIWVDPSIEGISEYISFLHKFAKKYNFVFRFPGTMRYSGRKDTPASNWVRIIFSFGKYPMDQIVYGKWMFGSMETNPFKEELWKIWKETETGNPDNQIYIQIDEYVRKYRKGNRCDLNCKGREQCPGNEDQWMAYAIFKDLIFDDVLESEKCFFI